MGGGGGSGSYELCVLCHPITDHCLYTPWFETITICRFIVYIFIFLHGRFYLKISKNSTHRKKKYIHRYTKK